MYTFDRAQKIGRINLCGSWAQQEIGRTNKIAAIFANTSTISTSLRIYIYVYIYIEREREKIGHSILRVKLGATQNWARHKIGRDEKLGATRNWARHKIGRDVNLEASHKLGAMRQIVHCSKCFIAPNLMSRQVSRCAESVIAPNLLLRPIFHCAQLCLSLSLSLAPGGGSWCRHLLILRSWGSVAVWWAARRNPSRLPRFAQHCFIFLGLLCL